MYTHPNNLKAKAALWLWQLRDVALFSSGPLISVFAVAQLGTLIPLLNGGSTLSFHPFFGQPAFGILSDMRVAFLYI